MNYYYPYSGIYLRQHMQRISLGLVKLAIYGTSAIIAVAVIYWLVRGVFNIN